MIVQVLNTLLDFLLSPLALVVFATFYRLPGLLRKLDFRRGTAYPIQPLQPRNRWRGHLLGAAWGLACDMPYVIMGIMLLGTIYMPFIFFGRVKYERHGHHDTFGVGDFKRILRECFFEFWLFHIPLLMLELVLCLFFLVDPWLLFDIYPHWNHLLSGGILISEIAAHLVANGVYLVCDLLHTPMFFLSLLQIWRLPTVLRVYKVPLRAVETEYRAICSHHDTTGPSDAASSLCCARS